VADGSPARAALTLLAGEVCARCAMLFMLAFGEPADRGSSSVPFVRALRGPRRTAGLLLALVGPLPFLLFLGGIAPLAVLVAPLLAALALWVSRSAFGGIGGDAVGATGEAARTVLLVIVSSNA
jgi:adenosylcobinamide-GDP ribazoletransferase